MFVCLVQSTYYMKCNHFTPLRIQLSAISDIEWKAPTESGLWNLLWNWINSFVYEDWTKDFIEMRIIFHSKLPSRFCFCFCFFLILQHHSFFVYPTPWKTEFALLRQLREAICPLMRLLAFHLPLSSALLEAGTTTRKGDRKYNHRSFIKNVNKN